jgi:hypothetical protein
MKILPITADNFPEVVELLKKNGLPTEDLSDNTNLFILEESNEVIGTIGLEHDNKHVCPSSATLMKKQL